MKKIKFETYGGLLAFLAIITSLAAFTSWSWWSWGASIVLTLLIIPVMFLIEWVIKKVAVFVRARIFKRKLEKGEVINLWADLKLQISPKEGGEVGKDAEIEVETETNMSDALLETALRLAHTQVIARLQKKALVAKADKRKAKKSKKKKK